MPYTRMRLRYLLSITLSYCLICLTAAAVSPSSAEFRLRDAWAAPLVEPTREDSPTRDNPLRISFLADGQKSSDRISSWTREITRTGDTQTSYRVRLKDPAGCLQVTISTEVFSDFPALEWVAHFKNTGTTDTPLIAGIKALDAAFSIPTTGTPILHWARGGVASFDDFAPQRSELKPGAGVPFNPRDGRSSSEILPFFNIQGSNSGVVLAIGWSGQWAADFQADASGAVHVRAGMAETSLVLHPGEEIRTPRMLALFYEGNRYRGQNLLRKFILAHHRPLRNGKPLVAPITNGNWGATRAEVHLDNIDKMIREKLPIEYYWIDAGWYGDPKMTEVSSWATNVGNWEIRRNLYPEGFKPLKEKLHADGRELMLWFEPERVFSGTPWHQQHAQWLLSVGDQNNLMNLGNPDARRFVTDFVSQRITEYGLGCYRQDFNMDPSQYWSKADGPRRRGISEIRHIEGLYAFWDELLAAHPNLIIDNCASGGRRIDLETISRAVPFWRTDGPRDPIAHQCHTYGLLSWVPLSATSQDRAGDDYEFRSSMSSALCINWEHSGDGPQQRIRKDFPYDWARHTLDQYLSIRDYYTGDYYPLTEYSTADSVWMAYQLDRPENGDGIVVILRRPNSPYTTACLPLHGLDPAAKYTVNNLDRGEASRQSGAELQQSGLTVNIPARPGSALIRYQRVFPVLPQ